MQRQVEALRIKILYEQSITTQSVGLINLAIFAYTAQDVVDRNGLKIWVIVGVSIFAIRMAIQLFFQHHYLKADRSYSPRMWEYIFCAGTLVSGLNWAIASNILLASDQVTLQTLLAFLLAGTTAGAAVAYSSSIKSVLSFLLPALAPFAFTLAFNGSSIQHAMAAMIMLYIAVIVVNTIKVHHYVMRSISLSFEKEELLGKLRTSQSEVMHAHKMSALGQMAGGLAHEVNTPLSAINLYMANLERGAGVHETATAVKKLVIRIAQIISSLRSFSSSDSTASFAPIQMRAVIEDTLALCENHFKESGMSIFVVPVPADVYFMGRKAQIAQALMNLLTNSYEATQGIPGAWARIEIRNDERWLELSISDNGRGIKAEIRDKIMQPFFTTKVVGQGPGLGLSTALGIAKEHGGDLVLDTQGQFTRFVIKLERLPGVTSSAA